MTCVLSVCAEDRYFNPAEPGGTQNVNETLAGDGAVYANDPSKGAVGTVRLNGANTYTGDTVVPTGTLSVTSLAPTGRASSIGTGGTLRLGPSVFRYESATAAVVDREVVCVDAGTPAKLLPTVFDLRGDVTFGSAIDLGGYSAFVKTGPGAFTFAPASASTAFAISPAVTQELSDGSQFALPVDGSVPSAGYPAFGVLGGSFVFANGDCQIPQSDLRMVIGGKTAATATAEEQSPVFEQRGGTFRSNIPVHVGRYSIGTVESPTNPKLKVLGGTFTQGGGKTLYTGYGSNHCRPAIEVENATITTPYASAGFNYTTAGGDVLTTLKVGKGGVFDPLYKFTTYNDNGSTTQVEIVDGGRLIVSNLVLNGGSVPGVTAFSVRDGGELRLGQITSAKGDVTFDFDGGTLLGSHAGLSKSFYTLPSDDSLKDVVKEIRIGPKGLTLGTITSAASGDFVTRFNVPFVARPGLDGPDGGLIISNVATGSASATADNAHVYLAKANGYTGPTVLRAGILNIKTATAIPAGSEFRFEGGILYAGDTDICLSDATFGVDGAETKLTFRTYGGRRYVVTGSLELTGSPRFDYVALESDKSSSTLPNRLLLTVPLADADKLRAMRFNPVANSPYRIVSARVDEDEGAATASIYLNVGQTTDGGLASFTAAKGYVIDVTAADGKYEVLVDEWTSVGDYTVGTFTAADQTAADAVAESFKTTSSSYRDFALSALDLGDGTYALVMTVSAKPATAATWTAGGGTDLSADNPANWGGDESPDFESGMFTATFASAGTRAEMGGTKTFNAFVFNAANGFEIAAEDGASRVQIAEGGIRVDENAAASRYGVSAPLATLRPQMWTVPDGKTLALKDALVSTGGAITMSGKGLVEFGGTNVLSGSLVATGTVVSVSGLLATPGHADQGEPAAFGEQTLRIGNDVNKDAYLCVSNAVVEKPVYSMIKMGECALYARPATTNVFRGKFVTHRPWASYNFGEGSETVFENGITLDWWTHWNGTGTTYVRNKPMSCFNSQFHMSAGTLVFETAGNQFNHFALGYDN